MDYLAMLLTSVQGFVMAGFEQTYPITDHVMQQSIQASEMFYKKGDLWFVRDESIPGDPALKAVAFNSKNVYLETSDFDQMMLSQIIDSQGLKCRVDPAKRVIVDEEGVKLISYSATEVPEIEGQQLEPRMLVTLSYRAKYFNAMNVLDKLWSFGAFKSEEEDDNAEAIPSGPMSMRMELRMDFRLRMLVEQRPYLLQKTELNLNQRLELRGILGLQTQLLRLTGDELERRVVDLLESKGEAETVRLLDFVLAGKVKRAKPQLTWKSARAIARKLSRV